MSFYTCKQSNNPEIVKLELAQIKHNLNKYGRKKRPNNKRFEASYSRQANRTWGEPLTNISYLEDPLNGAPHFAADIYGGFGVFCTNKESFCLFI